MGDDGLITGIDSSKPAAPDNYAGAGPVESIMQTFDSWDRLGDGDYTEIGLNAAAAGLDLLSWPLIPSARWPRRASGG